MTASCLAACLLEDVDGHVEVVVLHGGGGVDGGQGGPGGEVH